jgi:glycosyltransferase involved in cell wall biosynthesis
VSARPSDRREGLSLLWVGARANFPSLDRIRPILERPEFRDLRLVTVSDHPDADVPWSTESARREIAAADIAVIPCLDTPAALAKSNNRLTMLMGAGLPVIASPIPAYRTVVESGRNGFLAEGSEDWASALRTLRDPETRKVLAEGARRTAWSRFAPELIAGRWESLLEELVGRQGLSLAGERQRVLSEP